MRRREFIAGLGSAAAWPVTAWAQQPAMPVIGFLSPTRPGGLFAMEAFFEGLKEGGYVEGRNAVIEYRWAEGRTDRLPALAADLVRRQVRIIVAMAVDATLAAKSATTTIPIVFQTGADPVGAGLVSRINQPGGNVTGVSNFSGTLSSKRLELLRQLVPTAHAIGILMDPTVVTTEVRKTEVREASDPLGLQPIFLYASTEQEIDAAFMVLVQRRIGALLVADNPFFIGHREQLVSLARFNAIPTMYFFRQFVVAGGLISYSTDNKDSMRRAGNYVARVLNGERAGDLPVQLPTKFELVINLKTAKALGLDVPASLLAIADEVIE
jgi:putative tryptophan/tyrosine transport system substrate-binding protein